MPRASLCKYLWLFLWPHAWAVHVGILKLLEFSTSTSGSQLMLDICFLRWDLMHNNTQLPFFSGRITLSILAYNVLEGPRGTDLLSTVTLYLLLKTHCIVFVSFFDWIPHSPKHDDTWKLVSGSASGARDMDLDSWSIVLATDVCKSLLKGIELCWI